MLVQEKTRGEIEQKLNVMSDFLKMEYLESCIKQFREFDVKRFCSMKLAELYEGRNMFSEAARHASAAADMATTFSEKIHAYMKETGLWIKAGHYERADESLRKGLSSANTREKFEMKHAVKNLYKKQAEAYERAARNSNALKVYQKLLELSDDAEKRGIKMKLLVFYEKLGKIREYTLLKNQLV